MIVAAYCWLLLAAQPPVTDLLAEGAKAIDAGRYADAVKALQEAVQKSPRDIAAQFQLGLAYSLAGQDPAAIEAFRKTLELKPGLYEAQVNLGHLYVRNQDFAAAEPLLKLAVTEKPKAERASYLYGQALLGQNKAVEAEPVFRGLLETNPKSVDAMIGLGRSLARQKKPAEAAQVFQQALAIEPANRDLLLETAALLEASGNKKEAIALYSQVTGDAAVNERLGNLLIEDHRPEEAIPHLEAAQRQSPTPANRYALAVAYLRVKKPEAALPLVAKILESDPSNTDARMFYGRLLRDQRKFLAAAGQFQAVTKIQPDAAEAWSELAAALILAELYPDALQALEQVRRLKGENPAYYYFRAHSLDHLKQYKPALESYKRFLELSENKSPDEEFKARQRVIVIQKVLSK